MLQGGLGPYSLALYYTTAQLYTTLLYTTLLYTTLQLCSPLQPRCTLQAVHYTTAQLVRATAFKEGSGSGGTTVHYSGSGGTGWARLKGTQGTGGMQERFLSLTVEDHWQLPSTTWQQGTGKGLPQPPQLS